MGESLTLWTPAPGWRAEGGHHSRGNPVLRAGLLFPAGGSGSLYL